MTKILIHEFPAAARVLNERLRGVLGGVGTPEATRLLERLQFIERRAPRLVLTGQFSSGKSTLIKALTDGEAIVAIDPDIATDSVTDYAWDGDVILVDTPGVQAGVREHDELAEDALAAADLVMFVVTPELFDDTARKHLRHVADDLGKADQLIVVVTMANTMHADDGIRQRAADHALGGGRTALFVECDAKDYLTGLQSSDSTRQARYVELSGMNKLRTAINDLSERSGQLAVDRQPLQLIVTTASEATALLTEDPQEQAALRLLARQRKALTARSQRIETQLQELRSTLVQAAIVAGDRFADDVDALDQAPDSGDAERQRTIKEIETRLEDDLQDAANDFATATQRMLELQFDDLASEVSEIGAGPQVRAFADRSWPQAPAASNRGAWRRVFRTRPVESPPTTRPDWASRISEWSSQFGSLWGAGDGVRQAAGSNGHKIVLEVGHFFGKKFEPWQAVRWANRLGSAVKVAGKAIPVAIAVGEVALEERRRIERDRLRRLRRRQLVSEVQRQAELIASEAQARVRDLTSPLFESSLREIDALQEEIAQTQRDRSAHLAELSAISAEARLLLGTAAGPQAPTTRRSDLS